MKDIKNKSQITFTKFTDAEKRTAKSYDLLDGELIKIANGNFWNGSFRTININYTELPDYINSMIPGEFLIQGVHQSLSEGNCPGDATRLKKIFPFTNKPGILCIDSDSVQKMNINSLDELNDVLGKIDPCLKGAFKVMSTSASSHIFVNDQEKNGLRGVHTYIPINTTKNNKDILEILHVRSVIAGYCYPKITKAGIVKIYSLVDKALCTSNQPIFEGGAILKNDSISQKKFIETFDGNMLSTNSISPLTQEEHEIYEKITEELKGSVAEEAQKIRQQFINQSSINMREKIKNLTKSNAAAIIDHALTRHELYGQFSILLEIGEEITVQNIIDNPMKYHQMACAHPLDQSIFGKSVIYSNQDKPAIHTFAHGGETFSLCSNYEEPVLADWEVKLNEHVNSFNQTHAQVMLGGKHKIMRTVSENAHYESRISYEFIDQSELKKIYANDQIQVGEKVVRSNIVPVMKDKITAWAEHKNCSVYRKGVRFAPGKNLPKDYFNTWRGFAVEPLKGANIDIVKNHIEQIICGNDPVSIEYFYNWIACTMQYPNKPIGSAIVLRGEKGTGKGTIGHFLRKIWGNHGTHISNPQHFIGKFNAHLENICFLFADEAFYSGNKSHEGILKALITEPTLIIERKGIDAISQPNFLKVFMVTNSDYAVPATKDERRYCVLDVANTRIGDKKYFDALNAACTDKAVQSTFFYEMLNRDISNFNVTAIPESQGLKDQRLYSLKSPGKWLVDSFTQGYFSISNFDEYECKTWKNEVSSAHLYKSYKFWCDSQKLGQYDIETQNTLGRYLTKLFKNQKIKSDVRGYYFGTLSEAIAAFEKYEKVNLDIDLEAEKGQVELDQMDDCSSSILEVEMAVSQIDRFGFIDFSANAQANVSYTANCLN
ncbi:DUF5906 domain-containing protein [Nitrosomonas sp. Nm34]|uniref:DUF5906 domain-containing protein n=1 Tax=Nitrosomonas sp. Nm34 TaxID=1881055 RepID=UPI0008F2E516|nr:DUF5906 domain-containing protein [Nitrosomonas sp. Nm34]SFI39800.1 hypothetical protein SAMN05428978_100865 [Nitrosomonas sp. Nm34]